MSNVPSFHCLDFYAARPREEQKKKMASRYQFPRSEMRCRLLWIFLPLMHFRLSHYCCSFISASWWFCFIAKLLPSKIIWLYITKMLLSCFTCSCSTLLPSHARVLLTNNCTIFESETFLLCTLYAYNHPPFLWYDKEIWHFLSAPRQTVNIFIWCGGRRNSQGKGGEAPVEPVVWIWKDLPILIQVVLSQFLW